MPSSGQRNGKGRQKVKMAKMEKKSNLQVTFSKRRYGLFKKASELCTLTGAKLGIIVYSPGRKVYLFGTPSVHGVVNKCFSDVPLGFLAKTDVGQGFRSLYEERLVEAHLSATVVDLSMELSMVDLKVEMEKARGVALEDRERAELGSHAPMENMSKAQLEQLGASLHALKGKLMEEVATRANQGYNSPPVEEMRYPGPGYINPMDVPGYGSHNLFY